MPEESEQLAQRAGMPLSAFALQELTEAAKPIQRSTILEALDACRGER
jgi:hypothetical protein